VNRIKKELKEVEFLNKMPKDFENYGIPRDRPRLLPNVWRETLLKLSR